jgi:hypothetical protein
MKKYWRSGLLSCLAFASQKDGGYETERLVMIRQYIRRTNKLVLLMSIVALTLSCTPSPTATPSVGLLEVDIDYSGTWYRETFGYTRRAKNIKHFVLVMPESEVTRATAAEVFTSIRFPTSPDVLLMREDRKEFSWALEYLYEAPEGHFRGQFEPGTYYVAAAFIAAPLSKEEGRYSDDDILYPGITGG